MANIKVFFGINNWKLIYKLVDVWGDREKNIYSIKLF